MIFRNNMKTMVLVVLQIHGMVFEPQCSKFHYEEKLLEKMIKMDLSVQTMNKEMEIIRDNTKETLADLKAEREKWEKSITDMNETSIQRVETVVQESKDKVKDELTRLREETEALSKQLTAKLTGDAVVFSARTAKTLSLTGRGQIMIYTEVILNEGDAYNKDNGVFTVPITGIYIFTAQFCMHPDNHIAFAFVANEVAFKISQIYRKSYSSCYSYDALSVVNKGDNVKIKIVNSSTGSVLYESSSSYWNMFSGVLIRAQ